MGILNWTGWARTDDSVRPASRLHDLKRRDRVGRDFRGNPAPSPPPKVWTQFEVIEFKVPFGGREIGARITRNALEEHFGAGEEPASWLRAYLDHRARIHLAVEQLVQGGVKEPVTLRAWHF